MGKVRCCYMKRCLSAWLILTLCTALVGGSPIALAEEQDDLSLDLEMDAPAQSDEDGMAVDGLSLELDLDVDSLEIAEPASAEAPQDNDSIEENRTVVNRYIRYEIANGEATVVSADKALTEANIPRTIKGYTVKHIAENAFSGNKRLWSVTVPETVTDIGANAFNGCTALVRIVLPESVTQIGAYAFKNCTMISHFELPEGLTVISEGLFENCQMMWKIFLPSTLQYIEDRAFFNCLSLKEFTLPEGLQAIGMSAFEGCEAMKNVSIPASLTALPDRAFTGCVSLKKATLRSGLETIGAGAFYRCDSLRTLNLPGSVTSVDKYAFAYCEDLKTLTIPGSIQTLGYGAFFHCGDLEELCVKSGVVDIGDYCFAQCKKLIRAEIPESVETIGKDVFAVGKTSGIDDLGVIQLEKPVGLPRKLIMYGRPDSTASEYAKENGISFVIQKIVATSVSIAEGKSATLYVGHPMQLTAIQKPDNAETKVKWSSDSSSVAVSKTGLLTPKHSGKATITVRTENGKKATMSVKVIDAKSVSIDQGKTATLKVGETLQLSATVLPAEVTSKLTWTSGSKSIATVSKTGLVTAKKPGTTSIYVKTANGKKTKIQIKVTK